jgi:hypothetical protein
MTLGTLLEDSGGIPVSSVWVESLGIWAGLQGSAQPALSAASLSDYYASACFARAAITVATATVTGATASGSTGSDLQLGPFTELAIDISVTARTGTSPTLQFFLDRKGADGVSYNVWSSSPITVAAIQVSASIGAGLASPQSFGSLGIFRWVLGGTSPNFTFSYSIIGK